MMPSDDNYVSKHNGGVVSIAILISFKYGFAWSSTTKNPEFKKMMLCHPKLVNYILNSSEPKIPEIKEIWKSIYPDIPESKYPNFRGAKDIQVVWIPHGSTVLVENLNGAEYYRLLSDEAYIHDLSDDETKELETKHLWASLN